jgi:hypothetical protein
MLGPKRKAQGGRKGERRIIQRGMLCCWSAGWVSREVEGQCITILIDMESKIPLFFEE